MPMPFVVGLTTWRRPALRGMCGSSSFTRASLLPHLHGLPASPLSLARRCVQYERTTATLQAINARDTARAAKWHVKSTKEYMAEVDSKLPTAHGALTTRLASPFSPERKAARRAQREMMRKQSTLDVQTEMARMKEYSQARFHRIFDHVLRQGKAFVIVYIIAYFGTLLLLYLGFASGLLRKDLVYDFLIFLLGQTIDRDKFFARVEKFDTYINFGFAVVVNEAIEIIRFPLVLFFFTQYRARLLGIRTNVRPSIFRASAAES